MSGAEILEWQYIGYWGVLCLGLMFLFINILGVGSDGNDAEAHGDVGHDLEGDLHGDVGHDLEGDLHGDVGHDLEGDLHGDVGHDLEGDAHGAEVHGEAAPHAAGLAAGPAHFDKPLHHSDDGDRTFGLLGGLLGLGRCPLSIILMTLCFLFFLSGQVFTTLLRPLFAAPELYGSLSYVGSGVVGLLLTGRIATLIGRFMPTTETSVVTPREFEGKVGRAVYAFDAKQAGFVEVKDRNKTRQRLRGVNLAPEKPIKSGDLVLIVHYDKEHETLEVTPAPEMMTED